MFQKILEFFKLNLTYVIIFIIVNALILYKVI